MIGTVRRVNRRGCTQLPTLPTLSTVCAFGIVAALVSGGLSSGTTVARAQSGTPAGQAPYDRVCKVCHGPEGKGSAAPALVPLELDVEELLIRVREGGGEMPSISASRITDDEVTQVAAYLKSLTPP